MADRWGDVGLGEEAEVGSCKDSDGPVWPPATVGGFCAMPGYDPHTSHYRIFVKSVRCVISKRLSISFCVLIILRAMATGFCRRGFASIKESVQWGTCYSVICRGLGVGAK